MFSLNFILICII